MSCHLAVTAPSRVAGPSGPAGARVDAPRSLLLLAILLSTVGLRPERAAGQVPGGTSDPAPARDVPRVYSDRLQVMSPDGRAHVAQHTLASDGVEVALRPPRTPSQVHFTGPDRARAAARYERLPGQIVLSTGSVTVRYRDRYTDELHVDDDGVLTLAMPSAPAALEIAPAHAPDVETVMTWVFPPAVDVLSWAASARARGPATDSATAVDAPTDGAWSFDDNVLGWSQRGTAPVSLEIRYRLAPSARRAAPVAATAPDAEPRPSPLDADGDGVPDARDVCLAEGTPADAPTEGASAPGRAAMRAAAALGCVAGERIALPAVGFETGQSRLDVPARRLLDRLGAALREDSDAWREGDGAWEIGAHTDGVGPRYRNRALSLRRAESVRHYLMLGGVAPERLVANGYGESEPVADNATAAGRAANRRVELRWLADPAQAVADPLDGAPAESIGDSLSDSPEDPVPARARPPGARP